MYKNTFLNWSARLYTPFIWTGGVLQSLFLLYMRLTWGYQFYSGGLAKLHDIGKVIAFFTSLHIPHPDFHAHLVAYIETICGFLLFIGLASRLVAVPLIITMLVALSTAHAPNISELRFLMEPLSLVHETPYPFLITSIIVFVFGPGKISIDALVKRWVERQPRW